MKTKLLIGLILAVFAVAALQQASAQPITLTGVTYTNAFDDMESAQSLPDGWWVQTGATLQTLGNVASFSDASYTARSNSWALTTGKFGNQASTFSYLGGTNFDGGESNAVQYAEPNRCLAVRQVDPTSSTFPNSDPGAAFVLKVADTAGRQNFALSVDLLNLDSTSTRQTIWTVDYGFGTLPSFFTRVASYTNVPGSFNTYHTNITFPNGTIDNYSGVVCIRIVALSATTGAQNRETFAIDNFGLTWSAGTACTPASISVSPYASTTSINANATLSVQAFGTQPLSYQWLLNGSTPVSDDGVISGSTGPVLTFTGARKTDQGTYSCVVTAACGSPATSLGALLTVNDFYWYSQPNPTNYVNMPGDALDLYGRVVSATAPTLQWRKNGTALAGLTDVTFVSPYYVATDWIQNTTTADAGTYDCVANNGTTSTNSAKLYLSVISTPSTRLARWDFNDTNAIVLTPAPGFGSGTAARIGTGGTAAFVSGAYQDPNGPISYTNSAWNTTTYPAAGVGSDTSGVQFNVSTVGYKDIKVAWQQKDSNTASKYTRLMYTTDGSTWTPADLITYNNLEGSLAFELKQVDLSGIPEVNNNANFAYRIVTEFAPSTSAYAAVSGGYGTAGTIRYDLMSIYGNTLPALAAATITSTTYNPGTGNISISITGGTAATGFRVVKSASLSAPVWTALSPDVTHPTSPYTFSFPIPVGGSPQMFFRVQSY